MVKHFFIITGTSRGIGEALSKTLLDEGHTVCGIARGESELLSPYENYSHFQFDLSQVNEIEQLITKILEQRDLSDYKMISLINNAAMVEPLKSIEKCQPAEISTSIHISLIAPMILSSCFIRHTEHLHIRRKIVNISSGAGLQPLEDMSVYCTAKAGLNMFTRCVGVEQSENSEPIEILAVDPGMVESMMQKTARGKDTEDFAMADFFKNAFTDGELLAPEDLVKDLKVIIEGEYEAGRIMNQF